MTPLTNEQIVEYAVRIAKFEGASGIYDRYDQDRNSLHRVIEKFNSGQTAEIIYPP